MIYKSTLQIIASHIAQDYNILCLIQNENPGPGSYSVDHGGALESERTSFSKKGLGGFASKVSGEHSV